MARFILEEPGEDVTAGGDDVDIIGTTSGGEYITIISGNITLDASFNQGGDTISLPGEAEDYTARFEGSRLILTSVINDVVISMPVPAPGTVYTLVFREDGDTRLVTSNEDGQAVIGDETLDQGETITLDSNDEETLTTALQDFADAEAAIDAFEDEAGMSIGDIYAAEEQCEEDLADARAMRSDAQLAADLALAQAELDSAEEDVNAVDGLAEAIEDLEAAEAAFDEELDEFNDAQAEYAGAEAEYEFLNPDIDYGASTLEGYRDSDGDIVFTGDLVDENGDVILTSEDGMIVLPEGVTEETNPGITELAAAYENLYVEFIEAVEASEDLNDAQDTVDVLDTSPGGDAARADSAAFEAAVADYEDALADYEADPTDDNENDLRMAYEDLVAEGLDPVVTDDDVDGTVEGSEIFAQRDAVDVAIADEREDNANAILASEGDNPRFNELMDERDEFQDAQDAFDERQDLIEECMELDALAADAAALEAARDAAADNVMAQGDYEYPETVDGAEFATDGNDIFVAGDEEGEDGVIFDFGEEGNDLLFIGEEYTVVYLDDDTDVENESVGNNDVLEAFIVNTDDGVMVYLEENTESGNETDGDFFGPEILLDGLTTDDITVTEGFVMGG